jgi:hypothetical protein
MKVLKHPYARAAVDARDVKINHGRGAIAKLDKVFRYVLILKVVEFSGDVAGNVPRGRLEVVIAVEFALVQNFIDGFAAVAAKGFVVKYNSIRTALCSAMVAIVFGHKPVKNWVNFL